MKAVVIYKSRTGFTEVYAKWISEELGADLMKAGEADAATLMNYDTIIYGGGLYASGIGGVKLITRNIQILGNKKIVVFGVGATPPRERDINEIVGRNFTEEDLREIRFFYMRGGFDFSRLNFPYKIMMTLFKLKLHLIKRRNPDARGMLASYENPMDFTNKRNIAPLVEYVTGE